MLYLYRSKKKKHVRCKNTLCCFHCFKLDPCSSRTILNLCRKLSGRKQHLRERNIVLHSIAENYTDDGGFLCHDYGQEMIVSPETKIVVLTENSIKKNQTHYLRFFYLEKKKKLKNTGIIKDFCIGFIGFYCK